MVHFGENYRPDSYGNPPLFRIRASYTFSDNTIETEKPTIEHDLCTLKSEIRNELQKMMGTDLEQAAYLFSLQLGVCNSLEGAKMLLEAIRRKRKQ